jgi:hypothetical protein
MTGLSFSATHRIEQSETGHTLEPREVHERMRLGSSLRVARNPWKDSEANPERGKGQGGIVNQ